MTKKNEQMEKRRKRKKMFNDFSLQETTFTVKTLEVKMWQNLSTDAPCDKLQRF